MLQHACGPERIALSSLGALESWRLRACATDFPAALLRSALAVGHADPQFLDARRQARQRCRAARPLVDDMHVVSPPPMLPNAVQFSPGVLLVRAFDAWRDDNLPVWMPAGDRTLV